MKARFLFLFFVIFSVNAFEPTEEMKSQILASSGKGDTSYLISLLDRGMNPDFDFDSISTGLSYFSETPTYEGVEGNLAFMQILLNYGANPNYYTQDGDFPASETSSRVQLELLHRYGADLNQYTKTCRDCTDRLLPLQMASHDHTEVLYYLSENNVRPICDIVILALMYEEDLMDFFETWFEKFGLDLAPCLEF